MLIRRRKYSPELLGQIHELYSSGLCQREVAERLGIGDKVVWLAMKRHGMPAKRRGKRKEQAPLWKGSGAKYNALHKRVMEARGRPKLCEVCGTSDPSKKYDWASLTGKLDDVNDFKRMCRMCHWHYDKRQKHPVAPEFVSVCRENFDRSNEDHRRRTRTNGASGVREMNSK